MSSRQITIQSFIDARVFSEFAWFDLLRVRKRWRRPALFAAFFITIAALAFSRAGSVDHAALLGGVLLAVGALLSPLLLVFCTTRLPGIGWRVVAGILCALCVAQIVTYAKMPLPKETGRRSVKTVDKSFLRQKEFWLGSAMLFCYISAEYAIVGWLVTYFQDVGILNANHSQMMNSLLWLVIFCGRMVGAYLTGKLSRSKLLVIDGAGMFAFFLLMFFSRTAVPAVIGLMGVGLFMATIYPSAFAFGSESIRGNDLGCSIMILCGSIGGVVTPALVGFVAERSGIHAGMGLIVMLTGLLLVSILLSVISVKRTGKRKSGFVV